MILFSFGGGWGGCDSWIVRVGFGFGFGGMDGRFGWRG